MSEETSTLIVDEELILAAVAARTATLTGTGKAIGPTGQVEAQVVVSDYAATPSIVVHIQQSDDDGVADAYADNEVAVGVTIAPVAAADKKIYRIPFTATKKYVRTYVVHADADSITYGVYVTTKGN